MCDVAATSGEILRRWSLWGRRLASPPGQSPVGPCPFLNAKSEEWRVKSEERKGLLMFHGTLFTLHSSLFTLRILRENGVWLCGQQGFQRPPNRSSYSARRWALWTYCLWQGLLMFHSTLITLHSLLFTLHSSLFTLQISREGGFLYGWALVGWSAGGAAR